MSNSFSGDTPQDLAARILIAVARFRHSKPSKNRHSESQFSASQALLLRRIEEEGETTAASLAKSEHVSQQAIAQSLAELKKEGLVETRRDPNDERKAPIGLTASGKHALTNYLTPHTKWLGRRIEHWFGPKSLKDVELAIKVLEKLSSLEDLEKVN